MTDVQAALGIHQLARIDRGREHRAELWEYYDTELAGLPLELPAAGRPSARCTRAISTRCSSTPTPCGKTRDGVLDELIAQRIGTGVHYRPGSPAPVVPRTPRATAQGDFPVAERIGERTLSLPLSATVSKRDADDVSCDGRVLRQGCLT